MIKVRLLFAAMISAALLAVSTAAGAYSGMPETVRIGIGFNDASKGIRSAPGQLQLVAPVAADIVLSDNNRMHLLTLPASTSFSILKDSLYSVRNGLATEAASGANMGSYRLVLAQSLKSESDALAQQKLMSAKGVVAYPGWQASGWMLLSGAFVTEPEAVTEQARILKITGAQPPIQKADAQAFAVINTAGVPVLWVKPLAGGITVSPSAPAENRWLAWGSRQFRGEMELRRLSSSDITVVNILPVEQYLYGVVPGEIESNSPPEALKAQAVAARTYTLNNLKKYTALGFDLCNTVYSQVYTGKNGEAASTSKAVEDTKGQIVTYSGKPALVYYFSSSGGQTENVSNVWGSSYPYLVSVDDPYEAGNSYQYTWTKQLTKAEISKILQGKGVSIGEITSVTVTARAASGRVTGLRIDGTAGSKAYEKESARLIFGLSSQWYDVSISGTYPLLGLDTKTSANPSGRKVVTASGVRTLTAASEFSVMSASGVTALRFGDGSWTITGKGWGHAVGMSQEGAKGFAGKGWTYTQILAHYFTGTKVE